MASPVTRQALTVLFVVDGTVFASWTSRLPEVQHAVGAGDAGLGVALIGTAIGALVAMPVTGWWCRGRAPAPVALAAGLVLCATVLLPGLATAPAGLLATLVVFGAAYGAVDVSMNSTAVQVADHRRRPLLPGFHAGFSAGNVLGAGLGAVLAAQRVPVPVHLAIVGGAGMLALLGCAPNLARGRAVHPARPAGRPSRGAMWLVLAAAAVTLACAFGEGTVANWSGIRLREATGAAPGVAPLGYAAFAVGQVLGRLVGTRITERYGARAVAVTGTVLGAAGFAAAQLPSTTGQVAGYGVVGIGLSCLFPLGIARAGELGGSGGVAVASTLGYGGFLLGPPVVGLVAGASTLGWALLLPPALLLAGLAGVRTFHRAAL